MHVERLPYSTCVPLYYQVPSLVLTARRLPFRARTHARTYAHMHTVVYLGGRPFCLNAKNF